MYCSEFCIAQHTIQSIHVSENMHSFAHTESVHVMEYEALQSTVFIAVTAVYSSKALHTFIC